MSNSNTIQSVVFESKRILLKFNNIEYGVRSHQAGTPSLQINGIEIDPSSLIGRKVIDHISLLGMRYDPVVVNNKLSCVNYLLYTYLLEGNDPDNGDVLYAKIIFPS